jgi:excisionase family DNA binding protein
MTLFTPLEPEKVIAQQTRDVLSQALSKEPILNVSLHIRVEGKDVPAALPDTIVALLMDVLDAFASGEAMIMIPGNAEFSTQKAADYLNVSRPYLVKLLENKVIPSRKVGKHRRVLFSDLDRYKTAEYKRSNAILDELMEHQLTYDEDD